MVYRTISIILIIVFLIQCSVAFSNGSAPNVPIDNHVYRDIDKLIAAGFIKDAIYGQRPWSRNEIVRMITEARHRLVENGALASEGRDLDLAMMAGDILERLEGEYRDEMVEKESVRFHALEEISMDGAYLDSPPRPVLEQNGLGNVRALINPLASYKEGRDYADGGTFALETVSWARPSKYFSFYAKPRLEVLVPSTGSTNVNVLGQQLYGKFTLGNLEMEVGRDSLIWGPGEHGGVLASDNSRNLDMVKISNDSPLILPWFLNHLGPSKFTFFVARLGPEYVLENAFVYGAAASVKPASFLELGFEHQITGGGKGALPNSVGDYMADFFFMRRSRASEENLDNREGINFRVQISRLHDAVIYGEGIFEDFGRQSFWPQFTQQMGFLSGLYFPLLTEDGSNDLRIEYEHMPAQYTRHGIYLSGLTLDGRLRGSELGPEGQGIHVTWGHLFPSSIELKGEAHYENRGNDFYTSTLTSIGQPDTVVKITDNPAEHRFRVVSSLEWRVHYRFIIRPQFGYERIWNYAFEANVNRNNWLGAISLKWFPGY